MRRSSLLTVSALYVTVVLAVAGAFAQTVTADFGNRLSTTYPIRAGNFGAQYSRNMPSTPLTAIYGAGFRTLRMHGWLQSVYASRTPNWKILDDQLNSMKAFGFHVILELTYTPPWLVPTVPGCPAPGAANSYKVPPTDVNTWATLAASIVAHVDQTFPGLVTDFEIWNEPELGTFCTSPNDASTRLNRYLALYAAAAPKIRTQAALDHAIIRIGGPAIVSPGAISQFIGGLVNSSSTAPYVDFVSFHKYPSGQSEVTGGMLWDKTSPSGVSSLYSRLQSTSTLGYAANYRSVASTVKAGKQVNPSGTLIYLDEFGANWAFSDDCCRNSPTYSPVLNGLIVADLLDTVYQGAHRVPDGIQYYSASNPPFCLIGDTGTHCGASNYTVQYPQFYLYRLLASSSYLALVNGGWMAKSVSPLPSTYGLAATAFYTQNANSILIINPNAVDYSSVTVNALNNGMTIGHVTQYLLNSSNKTIKTTAMTAGTSVKVAIPRYSVIAINFTR